MSGLGESVRGEWNGDVDLNDGAVSHLYNEYKQHLDFVTSIGREKRSDRVSVKKDLCQLKQHMVEDIEFVTKSERERAKCMVANSRGGYHVLNIGKAKSGGGGGGGVGGESTSCPAPQNKPW